MNIRASSIPLYIYIYKGIDEARIFISLKIKLYIYITLNSRIVYIYLIKKSII